jgi:hypothetical protein
MFILGYYFALFLHATLSYIQVCKAVLARTSQGIVLFITDQSSPNIPGTELSVEEQTTVFLCPQHEFCKEFGWKV